MRAFARPLLLEEALMLQHAGRSSGPSLDVRRTTGPRPPLPVDPGTPVHPRPSRPRPAPRSTQRAREAAPPDAPCSEPPAFALLAPTAAELTDAERKALDDLFHQASRLRQVVLAALVVGLLVLLLVLMG